MINKIKVAWICHFSNPEIRNILPISGNLKYVDFAPWIVNLLHEFEKRDDVDLHVIAPHTGMKRIRYSFKLRGINYHFFNPDMPFFKRNWPSFFALDKWTGYLQNKFLVNLFLKKIRPNIINLHGAENDYYSSTVLGIKNIPVYVCIQGIYSNPDRFNEHSTINSLKAKIERRIHKENRYFGIFPPFFADLIKRDNKNPILLQQSYVIAKQIDNIPEIKEKKFDFVFFAQIGTTKGIEKILEAIAFLKKDFPNISLNVVGRCTSEYLNVLKKRIQDLDINENVFFTGYLPTLKEVYSQVRLAKVSVISSKFENLPSTIIESVFLGVPIAATRVGGIPYLNKEEETILLSNYGDVIGLADNMKKLLENPVFAKELTQKCRKFILKEFNGEFIADRYIKQYHAIVENFKWGTPIPEELLFNKDLF